jgi:hypothetical protein
MHWLVEVSRVGEESPLERYCIDARRWQSALQEARRLRGDAGALPKLTIELLDHGYRAVDPALNVRYLVTEAPPDMALTEGALVVMSTRPPPAVLTAPPGPSAPPAPAPAPATSASISSVPPRDANGVIPAQVIRQRDEQPAGDPIAYRELALAVRSVSSRADVEALLLSRLAEAKAAMPRDAKRYVQIAVFDHMFVKRPVRPPLATLMWKEWRGDPVLSFPGFGAPVEPPPTASLPPRPPPSWMPQAGAAPKVSVPPVAVPVIAVDQQGLPPAASTIPRGPSVAPAPVGPVTSSSPPAASSPAWRGSVKPSPMVVVGKTRPPPAPAVPRVNAATAPPPPPPPLPTLSPSISVSETIVSEVPPSGPALEIGEEVPDSAGTAALLASEQASAAASATRDEPPPIAAEMQAAATIAAAPLPLVRRSEPPERRADAVALRSDPPVRRSDPAVRRSDPAARRSDPGVARRRAPGEDLIGELFERMHELSFHVDLVSGADFVVRVLSEMIPCEGTVVHAFDLAKHEFVVIRAQGPRQRDALLHRTPDVDPVVHAIMRARSLMTNGSSPTRSGAFEKLGVEPRAVLAGAARQGGRYLGIIELANPHGGTPFHDGEVNALEYVCEQFAEFVSQRPVVLDPDVVLGT